MLLRELYNENGLNRKAIKAHPLYDVIYLLTTDPIEYDSRARRNPEEYFAHLLDDCFIINNLIPKYFAELDTVPDDVRIIAKSVMKDLRKKLTTPTEEETLINNIVLLAVLYYSN